MKVGGWGGSFKRNKKRNWVRGGEEKKFKKKTEIGDEKGKRKKVNLPTILVSPWNPISAPSIQVGGCWFTAALKETIYRKP